MKLLIKQCSHRNTSGQSITVLIAFVGLFVIAALGLLAFEISRYTLAKEQLKNCVDAAALAGQATLATYSPSGANNTLTQSGYADLTSTRQAEAAATKAAYKIFRQNSVLGVQLKTASFTQGQMPQQPQPNQGALSIQFEVPKRGANSGSPNSAINQKIIHVTGAYGVVPAFGSFLGLQEVPAWSSATAALPMTDVMNCFDVSGSMDDQTKVTFVKRVWSPSGYIDYQPVRTPSGLPAEGSIDQILGSPPRGTNVNALSPQGLENASSAPSPLKFSETDPSTRLLRGVTNTASPPGNHPGQVNGPNTPPSTGGPDVFTDLVVNLDGQTHFGGMTTGNGYSFPNIGVVVEAQRGNLENDAVFQAAGLAGNPYFAGITPRPGYKAMGYEATAQQLLKPFNSARNAALNFSYVLLHTNNCQLGDVSFNDHVGTTDLSCFTAPSVSQVYPQADFPKPSVYMLPNQFEIPMSDQLFYIYKEYCTSGVARIWGPTSNVPAALMQTQGKERAALNWLNDPTHHRPSADRAIVVLTNSSPPDNELGTARQAAAMAHDLGIPIYIIGLAEAPGTQAAQYAAFNDADSNQSSGGICAIAGHGSRFFQVTSEDDLPLAYGNVLRQLVRLVE